MKRVLVTGAQGFVGRWLVHALDRSGLVGEIFGIGRSAGNRLAFTHKLHWGGRCIPAPLPPGLCSQMSTPYHYQPLDICDSSALATLLADVRPHWVFHMASGLRDDPPGHLCRTNVEGTTVLTHALIDAPQRPERVIFGSSGSVYGASRQLPLSEDATTEPTTLYGVTKLAAERASALLASQHALPSVWARLFNLVGPGQDERHVAGRFASVLAALQSSGGPLRLAVGPLDTTRDFIDVRDVAQALLTLARSGRPGRAYNVGSGIETPIRSVLDRLLQAAGLSGQVQIDEGRPGAGDVDRHVADVRRLRALGFTPEIGLDQSLRELFAYYTDCLPSAGVHGTAGAAAARPLHEPWPGKDLS